MLPRANTTSALTCWRNIFTLRLRRLALSTNRTQRKSSSPCFCFFIYISCTFFFSKGACQTVVMSSSQHERFTAQSFQKTDCSTKNCFSRASELSGSVGDLSTRVCYLHKDVLVCTVSSPPVFLKHYPCQKHFTSLNQNLCL